MVVTTNGIQIETLTPAFGFFADPYNEDHRSMVTNCLAALRESFSALQDYYNSISSSEDSVNPDDVSIADDASEDIPVDATFDSSTIDTGIPSEGYPYAASYTSLQIPNITTRFTYLYRPYPTKLLFLAQSDQKQLFIKFTRQYSKEAHLLLSEKRFAPKLLGFEALPGGWLMVVMESVAKSHQSLSLLTPSDRSKYRQRIEDIVTLLHENGFVHGDLRSSNLLVPSAATGEVLLVDFDEAGRDGIATYPPNLNTTDIKRPKTAVDGALITKKDDEFMLSELFKETKETTSQWRLPTQLPKKKSISKRRAHQ
jgi:hypothetical protein